MEALIDGVVPCVHHVCGGCRVRDCGIASAISS